MNKKLIMIADDDSDLVYALSARIRNAGFEVMEAEDGLLAACELFLTDDNAVFPDVVILDIEMPEMDGLTICEDMLLDGVLGSIPVIILTGHSDEATIRRVKNLGAHYVQKSSNCWQSLEPVLRQLLDVEKAADPSGRSADVVKA